MDFHYFVLAFTIASSGIVAQPEWSITGNLFTGPLSVEVISPPEQDFSIICRGNGSSDLYSNMQWIGPDGNVIPEGSRKQKIAENVLQLSFSDPEKESGTYKCTADFEGSKAELEILVILSGKEPNFLIKFENVSVEEGSTARLICEAYGEQPKTYEWYDENEEKISGNVSRRVHVSTNYNSSVLIIEEAESQDEGLYMCTARNSHGLDSKTFELSVRPQPGNDSFAVEIENLTENSVSFRFYYSGDPKFIKARFAEMETPNSWEPLTSLVSWDPGHVREISGLQPSGRYHFQFQTNLHKWTSVLEVVLLPDVPVVTINYVSNGMIHLEWLQTTTDIVRKTIDFHELSYNTVRLVRGNIWEEGRDKRTTTVPSSRGSRYIVEKLISNNYYEIKLRAHTAGGYGKYFKQKFYMS